jgi:hypothetical protein
MHRAAMTRCTLAALAAAAAVACGSAATAPTIQRFDDDYEAARAAAARSKLPLAVEVWAPW